MDILGLFDVFFSSLSLNLKARNVEETKTKEKVRKILKTPAPKYEVDYSVKNTKAEVKEVMNYPSLVKLEIEKRKRELAELRQQQAQKNKQKNHSPEKNYGRTFK